MLLSATFFCPACESVHPDTSHCIIQASTMSRSPHYVSLKCQALRNALRTVQQSDRDRARWEWDEDDFPISPAQSYVYELYPYSRASYDPETEWGTYYRSLKWEIPEVNDWNLTMMDSKLDGSAGERHNWWGNTGMRAFFFCQSRDVQFQNWKVLKYSLIRSPAFEWCKSRLSPRGVWTE